MNWVHPTCLVLGTVAAVFLQTRFAGFRPLLAAQPDLVPVLVVYAALNASLPTTAVTAVVGGLAFDAMSAGPLGLTVVPLVAVGFFLHRRRDLLLRDSSWAQASLGGAASLAVAVASVVLLFLLWPLLSDRDPAPPFLPELRRGLVDLPVLGWGNLWQLLVVTVGGALASPLVFRLFRWIDRTFNYQPVPQASYRADREIKRGRF